MEGLTDIISTLEAQRIQTLERSERYSDLRVEATRARGEAFKSLVTGVPQGVALLPAAAILRKHYYDMLSTYRGGSFAFSKALTKRGAALWMRVLVAQQASGVPAEQFIRAQFVWFHKAFGKEPAVTQLATEAATNRAVEVGGTAKRNVVSNNKPAAVSLAEVFRESERLVQDIMRAQKCVSREAFYRDFVLTGVFCLPEKFLQADPAWRKVA